jgi:RNase P/RNase MRP subunit p29
VSAVPTRSGGADAAGPLPTPETIVRHELAGLRVRVHNDPCADREGIAGRVVRETERTLVIDRGHETARVPKAGATFAFDLSNGTERVTVAGERLVAPPAERTEQEVRTWR